MKQQIFAFNFPSMVSVVGDWNEKATFTFISNEFTKKTWTAFVFPNDKRQSYKRNFVAKKC